MIIFIYGKDTYRSKQSLSKMVEKFRVERDPQGLNLVRLDAESGKQNIIQEILSAPFLAEKRMVVLENVLVSKNDALQKELLARIEAKTLPEDVILVIWEGIEKPKLKQAKELFERLLKEQYTQYFEELTGAKLTGWILAEVKSRGGAIERDAAHLLGTNVGADMWRLNGLIEQLIGYTLSPYQGELEGVFSTESKVHKEQTEVSSPNRPPLTPPDRGGRAITPSDVQLFTEEKVDDNIFTLVDAIVSRQTKHVYTMMQEQYRQGNDAGYLFAMIIRQFRILLQLRDLYDRGENLQSASLAKELGLHPFVIKKSLPMVKRYPLAELKQIHAQLLDIDIKTKTGQGDQSMLLDLFVGRV
jgi:DNA polymerase-3 subunit delta